MISYGLEGKWMLFLTSGVPVSLYSLLSSKGKSVHGPRGNHKLNNVFFWLQTIFLPVVGLVDPDKLKPGDLVGVNKDSYLILDTLPSEYDSRVKAMEVDEKPTEDYNDIGGLEKQVSFNYWQFIEALFLWLANRVSVFDNFVFANRSKN